MRIRYLVILLIMQSGYLASQWTEQTSGVSVTLYAVSAVDNNTAWICGLGGVVLLTTNGGQNWNLTSTPNPSLFIYTIYGISKTTALLAGNSSSSYLYRTTNSGNNWTEVFTEAGGFINSIAGSQTDSNYLFMNGDPVGGRWSLWQSFNGGAAWDSTANNLMIPDNGSEAGFINSLFMDYGYIWFGTINERIYRIDNSGFFSQPTTGLSHVYGIWFNNALTGMAGASSMVLSQNSGANWLPLAAPGSGLISGVTGTGNQWWFTKGTSVYYSSNNGNSWSTATTQSGFYYHITKARAANNNNIWAIRQGGGISKFTYITSVHPVNDIVPVEFRLYQNYTNPFNPSTIIKFDIPSSAAGRVILTVYDILGREISVPVDKELNAGSYEADFDGSELTSGIYFYRIGAGTYSQVKKMILIK
jgi:hypothetical protein